MDAGKTLLAYKGEAKSTGLWAFLNPFDVVTRIVLVASLVGVSVVFAVLGKLNTYREELRSSDSSRRRSVRWPANSFWFLYTTFMQQGPDVIPTLAGKVLVAGWFFFCLVIVATYTANLAAFLTVRSFEDSINSLDDLAAQTDTVYGTVKNTSVTEFFETSPLEIHQRMPTPLVHWWTRLMRPLRESNTERRGNTYSFGTSPFSTISPLTSHAIAKSLEGLLLRKGTHLPCQKGGLRLNRNSVWASSK